MKKGYNITGNLLGGSRAEIDNNMLNKAFVETHDFQALVNTKDFNFVVGRRGTGKSVLFIKISEYIKKNKIGYVYSNIPQEYEQLIRRKQRTLSLFLKNIIQSILILQGRAFNIIWSFKKKMRLYLLIC